MKKSPQGERWRRLDNTAKIFPVIASENLSNVFRISAVLKDEVDPGTLQRALEEILPQFEGFSVRLRRGFFWYYFENNKRMPVIERETTYPCKYIDPHSNQLYLFRVTYFDRRINLEVFHAITDGLGAVNFLKALVYRYLDIKRNSRTGHRTSQKISSNVSMNVEDSYVRHYKKTEKRKYSTRKAYHLAGETLPLDEENVLHGYVDLKMLKTVAKSYGVSITRFLTAALIWAIYQEYLDGKPCEESIGISIPINLRTFFGSETTANFFAVTLIDFLSTSEVHTFTEVLEAVSSQMDLKITKEKMEQIISYNVSNEKKWYLRAAPLFVKWCALNLVFRNNEKAYTMTLSNIGPIDIEEDYRKEIERFTIMIGVSKRQPMKCAVCSYGEEVIVTFTSVFQDTRLQDRFFGFLREMKIPVSLESNGVPDRRDDLGMYPQIRYDQKRLKKLAAIFYGLLFFVGAILGVINYATYSGSLWSIIAIGLMAYTALTVEYSILRHANLASKILMQTVAAQVLLVALDHSTGYNGWSVNYGIPSTILFADLSVVFLILVNRMNWQSYFMYQIAITVFSFIPLILWAAGLLTRPFLALFTVTVTVIILAVTIVLGDRSVKTELKRRFHV
ncbi:Alcohol acetyltransferase [Clostridium sp. C105KSO15]|nr:Alcohol acetyltransferase [Clostridium sp. C105KSO15]